MASAIDNLSSALFRLKAKKFDILNARHWGKNYFAWCFPPSTFFILY